jgi:hypothetical protein
LPGSLDAGKLENLCLASFSSRRPDRPKVYCKFQGLLQTKEDRGIDGSRSPDGQQPAAHFLNGGMVAPTGIEPVLSALKGPRVNQLHHGAKH